MDIIFNYSKLEEQNLLVAGGDEVGRGSWFGPVVAAAVVFSPQQASKLLEIGVKDSKRLSAKKRLELAIQIKQLARGWRIGYATVREIDDINILQASLLAMKRAFLKLPVQPDLCLIDGQYLLKDFPWRQKQLIRGDESSPIIAAASIVAKVWRDEMIIRWASKYPQYDLSHNKGYGTKKHRLALMEYGPSRQHRLSFRPCQVASERIAEFSANLP